METANAVLDADYALTQVEVEPGDYVLLSVSDTGSGMDAETVARAFEPFFTTKEVGKGSGLGLSMVYGFVKQSRGHVRIYSETGVGTAVKMYLPRAGAAGPVADIRRSDDDVPGGGETILVVEDDALVLEHVAALLGGLGYSVVRARDGAEALSVIERSEAIDLLFTDIVMPGGLNGREVAERALARRPGLRVLFTSGYTQNTIVHHGRLDPGLHFLNKPYRRSELGRKLRTVLDGPG